MKNKKRCSEHKCTNFKFKGDERCLNHIQAKYAPVWYKSFGSINGVCHKDPEFDNTDNETV